MAASKLTERPERGEERGWWRWQLVRGWHVETATIFGENIFYLATNCHVTKLLPCVSREIDNTLAICQNWNFWVLKMCGIGVKRLNRTITEVQGCNLDIFLVELCYNMPYTTYIYFWTAYTGFAWFFRFPSYSISPSRSKMF